MHAAMAGCNDILRDVMTRGKMRDEMDANKIAEVNSAWTGWSLLPEIMPVPKDRTIRSPASKYNIQKNRNTWQSGGPGTMSLDNHGCPTRII